MKRQLKLSILSSAIAGILIGCSASDAPQTKTVEVLEVSLNDVPASVSDVVMANSPDFKIVEVLKKRRDGRVYYDVEGELPNGDEIEFDVLMTESGPKVVEIQRDIEWEVTPKNVQDVIGKANIDKLDIVRVIESQQAESDTIIYEIFVDGQSATPRFEVSVSGDAPAELLAEPAEH